MRSCPQMPGLSVLQHGESVNAFFLDLHAHLTQGSGLTNEWRLPSWVHDAQILPGLLPLDILSEYQIMHDCGKPRCRTVDAEGRQHFPDHARVSAETYRQISQVTSQENPDPATSPDDVPSGDRQAAQDRDLTIIRLISMDMDAHLLKSEDLPAFAQRPEAISLLVTALCEIHANAVMFGGIESTSFKIKWKHLEKRGRQVLAERARSRQAPS